VLRDLFVESIPQTHAFWKMRYGTSLEVFPKLNALGCKMRRINVYSLEDEKLLIGN
jgi:hypothetical protein